MKFIRILFVTLSVALALLTAAVLYLFDRSEIPEDSSYTIDLAALSRAARETAGELPVRVNHVKVAEATMPRAALFSGFDFAPHPMVHGAYQVVWADGSYALIDAGFGPAIFEQMAARGGEARYDEAAFRALTEALPDARLVTITHEHLDHIQGLAEVEDPQERTRLAAHTLVPAAQLENPQTAELLPAELIDAIEPLRNEGVRGIAPGIAVQPAAGHTPGSQLVYVELQEGTPLLFIGDVAWHMDGIRKLEYRPRLVTDVMLGEDRQAVMAQFRTLHEMLDDPSVTLVSSHDLDQLTRLQGSGVLGDGLETPGL